MKFRPKEQNLVEAFQLPSSLIVRDNHGNEYEVLKGEWLLFFEDGSVKTITDKEFKSQYEPVVEGGMIGSPVKLPIIPITPHTFPPLEEDSNWPKPINPWRTGPDYGDGYKTFD